jgi:RecB family exonuclease
VEKEVVDVLDASDDERRLLYVALTRAKETVTLSYSEKTSQDKSSVPSRFLEELDQTLLSRPSKLESQVSPLANIGATLVSPTFPPSLLSHVLEMRGLSATALNNYLESPWNYLYRNVLRMPEVQSESMLFGTVVHGVMERVLHTYRKKNTMPSATELKLYLEQILSKLPLTHEGFTRMHEKGLASLVVYVELETGLPHFPVLTLTGKLDRLDFDAEGNVVRVYDYKTGKPKTRNDIEGKTAGSQGNYKRQLTFYALLLSLYGDERYLCREGVLSFVEPDTKGQIHEEEFSITDAEIETLKAELVRVADEIVTGKFLDAPCDSESSSYCHLVSMLKGI